MKLSQILFSIYLLLISFVINAQTIPLVSIPFEVEKNCIFIYAKVNETDSIRFLFDTGANSSVINEATLEKLNLQIDGESLNVGSNGSNLVKSSSKNQVTFGKDNLTMSEVTFTIIPFEASNFEGIIGSNLMKGFIIEIDYDKLLLNFYNKSQKIDLKNYHKEKLHFINDYPTLKSEIIIDNKKYKGYFGIDTGADDALTIASPFSKKHDFNNKLLLLQTAYFQGSDGSIQELPIVLCPELKFAKKSLYRIPIALSNAKEGIDSSNEIAGFYGNAFLKRFNIIIDFDKNYIYFKLNNNLYSEF